MLERVNIQNLDDYFTECSKRRKKGVYFCRLTVYSVEIEQFIKKYYNEARKNGVVIEGKIPNPDEKNLSYYEEIMGMGFQMSLGFLNDSLKKWLPRMNDHQRERVVLALYDTLDSLQKAGKTENMLKNAYIKFMCWLYYKFERIINQLGADQIPKILYEGYVSSYERMMLSILSQAGCDILLLQYEGDQGYLKVDPGSVWSEECRVDGAAGFPQGFSLKRIREIMQDEQRSEALYGARPNVKNSTNSWIKGTGLDDFRETVSTRGKDPHLFYNCFYRINGVSDKLFYAEELYRFQLELKNSKRNVVIVDKEIPKPTPDEIAAIKRNNYTNQDQMIRGLAANMKHMAGGELYKLMNQSFVDSIQKAAKEPGISLNKLTNRAVYLLCWLNRYQAKLFEHWNNTDIACFIYLGGCKNSSEAMFVSFLARLPVDVLILCPNLNERCCLTDDLLYELNYTESLVLDRFPVNNAKLHIGTAAYHAERELDTLMYQDTGLYRNQQYTRANVINLQTMYEEIRILWDQELKYRPSFSVVGDTVNIPVIFSKVSGVKDGELEYYWGSIQELLTENTVLIQKAPYLDHTTPNPVKPYATEFYKNGKLLKTKMKQHPKYPYGILREEVQEVMLEKLQMILEEKRIRGIGENGTEYTVISTVLNLPKDILRMIQKFDFTKKNPKLIYVNAAEQIISLEDTILVTFLNLIGFDILFFIPTGYQSVEKYLNQNVMEEHQIGEYVYDLQVPDLKNTPFNKPRQGWRNIIFKRGN